MRPSDPFLRRRLRLNISCRLAARLIMCDQADQDGSLRWWKAALSTAVDVASMGAVVRATGERRPTLLLAALTTADALVWSDLGGDSLTNTRGLAMVGLSAAIEAGYQLRADAEMGLGGRLRDVALSATPTLALCGTRRLRRRWPRWGLLGWPALGAAGGFAAACYSRAEERRRLDMAGELEAELTQVAKVLAAADHTEPTAWNHVMRLENGLLTLAGFDPTIADEWRALMRSAAPTPPPGYVRLSAIAGDIVGEDNPLLHPSHAEQLDRLGAMTTTVRALPSPGLRRPGDQLDLELDGHEVVLPPTRHRLGSDAADRYIDPAPVTVGWGGLLTVADWTTFRPPLSLVLSVAIAEWAVGLAHAKLRLTPAQTLRNDFLVATYALIAGAAVRRRLDPIDNAGLLFGGAAFPYAVLLGHFWKTLDSRQRYLGAAGAAVLGALLAARAAAVAPSVGKRRFWLRTLLLDNISWWVMLFVTALNFDHDLEEDLAAAMSDADRITESRFDAAYADAWRGARGRVAARAALLSRALDAHGDELPAEVAAAIREDLVEVVAWLAGPSS